MTNAAKRLIGTLMATLLVFGAPGIKVVEAATGPVPTEVRTFDPGTDHFITIKDDGTVWGTGSNNYGQMGDGTTTDRHTETVKIMDGKFKAVEVMDDTSFALSQDGTLYGWGAVSYMDYKLTPVKYMDQVVDFQSFDYMAWALKNDGTLWSWGSQPSDSYMNEGPNQILDKVYSFKHGYYGTAYAIRTDGTLWLDLYGAGDEKDGEFSKIADDVIQVIPIDSFDEISVQHAAYVKKDGSLWEVKLGDGKPEHKKVMDSVKKVEGGLYRKLALKEDGSVWQWGEGWYRNNDGDLTSEPIAVPEKVTDNAIDIFVLENICGVLKKDGSYWSWGRNAYGEVGDGTRTPRYQPVKVMDSVSSVNIWYGFAFVQQSDGDIYYMGYNGDNEPVKPYCLFEKGMLPAGAPVFSPVIKLPETDEEDTTPAPTETPAPTPTEAPVNYLYDIVDPGEAVTLPSEKLEAIASASQAATAVKEVIATLTAEQKSSATGIDRVTLFAEEAIAQAASEYTQGSITIDLAKANALEAKVKEAKEAVETALASEGIIPRRELRTKGKILADSGSLDIKVASSTKQSSLDSVAVDTPYGALEFSSEMLDTLDSDLAVGVSNGDTILQWSNGFVDTIAADNALAIKFDKELKAGVKLSIPATGDDSYLAIVNEKGEASGGKFNPATGRLEAVISASSSYSIKDNKKDFADIQSKSKEMQKAISVLTAKGIISGTGASTFSPDQAISRAEIAALVLRALSKLNNSEDGQFSDVSSGDWYFGAAGSAKKHGIMAGTSATEFSPKAIIPKDQIVAVAARVLRLEMKYKDPADTAAALSVYSDAGQLADWSKVDISLAARENLAVGRSDGKFAPTAEMTRGDAAVVLYRLFNKLW
ncbi:MAG: S-layer homology domain-containing protein [Clostridiales bacterium]|nr:S-layer homology domain-containing protein [Clostridiales bacterium]